MDESKQDAESIRARGNFEMSSDVASTQQRARDIEADSASMKIRSQQPGLKLGQYGAVGVTGVVALVVIALAWFVMTYLTH